MCYNYFFDPRSPELREFVEAAQRSRLMERFARLDAGDIRPTNVVPVIATSRAGEESVFPMRWGFRLPNGPLLVNARSETAATKPTFREAWAAHRCIVPASWYFEWEHLVDETGKKKTGPKYQIRPEEGELTFLCGLYRMEEGLPVFTVLTREPSEEVRRIHDRMPLILPKELIREWIDPKTRPEELVPRALTRMALQKAG